MRFYPSADVNIYKEKEPLWSKHCRNPDKSWRIKPLQPVHPILHWRDLEGARKKDITIQDLYFEDWPRGRIRPEACLPIYYCMGSGFIRLERKMGGFKCTPMPIPLRQARVVQVKQLIQEKENKAKEAEEMKKQKEEAKKQREKEKAEKAKLAKEGKLNKDKPKKEPKVYTPPTEEDYANSPFGIPKPPPKPKDPPGFPPVPTFHKPPSIRNRHKRPQVAELEMSCPCTCWLK